MGGRQWRWRVQAETDRKLFLAGSGPCLFSTCSPCLSSRFSETPPGGGAPESLPAGFFWPDLALAFLSVPCRPLPPAFSPVLPLTFPFLSIVFPLPFPVPLPLPLHCTATRISQAFSFVSLAVPMDFPFVAPLPGLRFKVQALGVRIMAPRLPGGHPQSSGRDPVAPRGALCSRF